ncbi:putative HECT-domain-containing protein [Rosellinia necatrix]|uniref:HECT-type E3 ubiquitin transferase n=1 Tax=Rosellinia necatrix TaxID=77044 RepID=A0A1W2TUU3_ROSNE|nr:putative HECT-domain-containing protein [Rosellinia necatrix]
MFGRTNRPSLGQYDFALRGPVSNDLPTRSRANSRFLEAESPLRDLQRIQADSSSSEDEIVSKPKPKPLGKHSRSMSHPFPSLFSNSKKKKNAAADIEFDYDDVDDHGHGTKIYSSSSQAAATSRVAPGPADFATGNCMTCAGLVRWPKDLQVFRCTKCLTINDITPYTSPPRSTIRAVPHPAARAQSAGTTPLGMPTNMPNLISIEHTRNLIKTCLRSALQQYISNDPARQQPATIDQPSSAFTGDYFTLQDYSTKPESSPSSINTPPTSHYNPVFDDFSDPRLEPNPLNLTSHHPRSHSTSYPETTSSSRPKLQPGVNSPYVSPLRSTLDPKGMFKRAEDYLIMCFGSHSCVNHSFIPKRSSISTKPLPEAVRRPPVVEIRREVARDDAPLSELDPKLLLLGNFAENGSWWSGGQDEVTVSRVPSRRFEDKNSIVTSRSPRIDWGVTMEWYHIVNNAAEMWMQVYEELVQTDPTQELEESALRQFEQLVLEAQDHLQRALLKCTEMLLKRPGRVMAEPQDVRFLLLLLVNPLLASGSQSYSGHFPQSKKGKNYTRPLDGDERFSTGRHSGILKRIFGLLANSSEICHHHLITWLSRLPEHLLLQIKEITGTFVTHRLTRQNERRVEPRVDVTDGLIPQMPNRRAGNTPATLHAALEASKSPRKQKQPAEQSCTTYTADWQIRAAARLMALVFAANQHTHVRRRHTSDGRMYGPLFATSDFYNTLVDTIDFKSDFELWESRRGKFTFCQYPFFLSIWAKIQILEFDAKRQMLGKAREAFFDSILSHKNYTQHLVFSVRRECLVDDSLQQVSEVVGSGSEDIKKALRIEFQGEEGVDGGGLRKEWFLLLVREVFNPDHGLFVYDEDSQFCYFNPHTFETSDQYFLVGVVLGLAIYNSTILDVALPPFAFRKLLAAAPSPAAGAPGHSRPTMNYTLDDLAEFRPALAKGLRQLLNFDGDVQSTFCLDFVVDVERYGTRVRVPLCPGGEMKMVTNSSRKEYVDLYVRYLLDTSVTRQFEPFKRGFFTVCAGNALTLFKPEEIELLVRGSDEPLDIASLKAVAAYTNWPRGSSPKIEPTILWFWDTFENASPRDQRKLLSFITGSDRIPAMGAASLVIKINCLGDDEGRYPSARTCFNILSLYRCRSRERLEGFLWRAVNESEGFGLK